MLGIEPWAQAGASRLHLSNTLLTVLLFSERYHFFHENPYAYDDATPSTLIETVFALPLSIPLTTCFSSLTALPLFPVHPSPTWGKETSSFSRHSGAHALQQCQACYERLIEALRTSFSWIESNSLESAISSFQTGEVKERIPGESEALGWQHGRRDQGSARGGGGVGAGQAGSLLRGLVLLPDGRVLPNLPPGTLNA